MKLAVRATLSVVVATIAGSAIGSAQAVQRPSAAPIRVLFIGNSFTYVNNLPELVRGLAAGMKAPVEIETEQVTVGGATLRQLWEGRSALDAIRRSKWDYVVLQEQSTLGAALVNGHPVISDPNRLFWPYARRFDQEIRRQGAKTVLLETWGQRGEAKNFDALASAYFTIGKELDARVIPAGLVWQRALALRPDLPLYLPDGSHPAPAGSYLAALATVATLVDAAPDSTPLIVRGHPTGFDGKPADSLGALARLDPATAGLFRRVVASVRREIREAGGYPTVPRPPTASAPSLPSGRPIPSGGLVGTWKGSLVLFTGDRIPPITLEIRAGAGNRSYLASATIQLDPVIREDPLDLAIEGQELRFSTRSPIDPNLRIQFRGVMTDSAHLEGVASIVSEERGWSFAGSWKATRQ
jgi:hypothetical protein